MKESKKKTMYPITKTTSQSAEIMGLVNTGADN